MSSNLTISTRICGFESAKITWMIPYLDNFTLIKIIKETYVDLIVTDIRFYRMKDFERDESFDVKNQFKQQTKLKSLRVQTCLTSSYEPERRL